MTQSKTIFRLTLFLGMALHCQDMISQLWSESDFYSDTYDIVVPSEWYGPVAIDNIESLLAGVNGALDFDELLVGFSANEWEDQMRFIVNDETYQWLIYTNIGGASAFMYQHLNDTLYYAGGYYISDIQDESEIQYEVEDALYVYLELGETVGHSWESDGYDGDDDFTFSYLSFLEQMSTPIGEHTDIWVVKSIDNSDGEVNYALMHKSNPLYPICHVQQSDVEGEWFLYFHDLGLSETVDISELQGVHYSIFPNPATSSLILTGMPDNSEWRILNSSGRLLKKGRYENSIDVQDLPAGCYSVIVNDVVVKFVKH